MTMVKSIRSRSVSSTPLAPLRRLLRPVQPVNGSSGGPRAGCEWTLAGHSALTRGCVPVTPRWRMPTRQGPFAWLRGRGERWDVPAGMNTSHCLETSLEARIGLENRSTEVMVAKPFSSVQPGFRRTEPATVGAGATYRPDLSRSRQVMRMEQFADSVTIATRQYGRTRNGSGSFKRIAGGQNLVASSARRVIDRSGRVVVSRFRGKQKSAQPRGGSRGQSPSVPRCRIHRYEPCTILMLHTGDVDNSPRARDSRHLSGSGPRRAPASFCDTIAINSHVIRPHAG